ncbi:hypothetical protein QZH41_010711, partial [Actinostola sp. cb2023]
VVVPGIPTPRVSPHRGYPTPGIPTPRVSPHRVSPHHGYPTPVYPHIGYPHTGYPHTGYPHTTGIPTPGIPTPRVSPHRVSPHRGYPTPGYPHIGYPHTGYPHTAGIPHRSIPTSGIPTPGIPTLGIPTHTGYPHTGYPRIGYPHTGYPHGSIPRTIIPKSNLSTAKTRQSYESITAVNNAMISNVDIALTVFFVIFVVIDLFINVVLGLAIHRKKSLQTPMNLLIFHLAIADILIGVFVVPRHILNYAITYPNDTSSDYICKLITGGNFIWTSVTASSGFLTIIALERLFAVVFPHKARLRITKRRLKWLVGACWLASFAFNLPSLLVLKYDHKAQFCLEFWPEWVNPKAYVGLAFFAGNFSVIAMYILYSMILYSLWKTRKAVSEVSRTARINARKRVTKMLILMTFFHTLCRTPNYTFYMLIYFDPDAKYGSSVYSFTVFLILLNSASHPFFLLLVHG